MKKSFLPVAAIKLLVALAGLFVANAALAATLTVTNINDSGPGTLREMVQVSQPGDTINFAASPNEDIFMADILTDDESEDNLPPQSIFLYSPIVIDHDLIINGFSGSTEGKGGNYMAHGYNQVLSGGFFSQIFTIYGGNVTISNLDLVYGAGNAFFAENPGMPGMMYAGTGGAIYNGAVQGPVDLKLYNCFFDQNQGSPGGAIYNSYYSNTFMSLINCTFFGNVDSYGGGAIENDGVMWLTNCTITGNYSDTAGAILNTGVMFLYSCTIYQNYGYADPGLPDEAVGGLFLKDLSSTLLFNTIVAGNSAGFPETSDIIQSDFPNEFTSLGYNFIGITNNAPYGWTVGDITGSTNFPMDPGIVAPLESGIWAPFYVSWVSSLSWESSLGYNGGPVPTLALSADSLAIDQGLSGGVTTDARGLPRPCIFPNISKPNGGDGSDIGAFEFQTPVTPLTIAADASVDGRLELAWPNGLPGSSLSQRSHPFFALESFVLNNGPSNSPGMWTAFPQPMRLISSPRNSALSSVASGSAFMARDIASNGPGTVTYYRLVGPATNIPFIPPAFTTAAISIGTNDATLTGNTTPYGIGTTYWFEYGPDTNYGQSTVTNTLATSTNLVTLSNNISGLASSSNYHFQLVVTDDWGTQGGGDTNFTTSNSVSVPTNLPVPVTISYSSLTSNSVVLNGTVNPEGSPTYAYFFYYDNTFTEFTTPIFEGGGTNATNFSQYVFGLVPGTTYYFVAGASNANGTVYGSYLSFTTPTGVAQPPPTVLTLAASSLTTSAAVLNGSVNGNGDGTTYAYFEYGPTTSYGTNTAQISVGGSAASLSTNLSGLASYTTYHYRIDAVNSGGTTYGADTNFTTAWVPGPPTPVAPGSSAPKQPFVTALTPTLTWSGASQASSYDIILSQAPYGSGNVVATFSVSGNSYQIPGGVLQAGTAYSWSMVSFNSLQSESSNSISLYFETAAAPQAQTLAATNVGPSTALLQGYVAPNGEDTLYYFQYGQTTNYSTNTAPQDFGITTNGPVSAAVAQLFVGTTYNYRLVASNSLGASFGTNVTFTTQAE